MLNIFSILIGIVALALTIPAFLPLLGWANWVILPIAVFGLAVGVLADQKAGRNLNLAVIFVGVVRLWLGGGIF